jgi:23S rRNA (uracil1939-C5)-methyltransferase
MPRLVEAIEHRALPTRPQRWELAVGTPAVDVLAVDEKQSVWAREPDGWHRCDRPVTHHFSGLTLAHQAGGFFQTSAAWAWEAFSKILAEWDLHGETLYDLYGGVGLFSAMLREWFGDFVLVESDPDAVAHARLNLANAKVSHRCFEADVEEWTPDCLGNPGDVVLLDPPRAGLPPELIGKLLNSRATTLVLVGCDGAAFCRDVVRLCEAWKIVELAAVDLFPDAVHVEFLALMRR